MTVSLIEKKIILPLILNILFIANFLLLANFIMSEEKNDKWSQELDSSPCSPLGEFIYSL